MEGVEEVQHLEVLEALVVVEGQVHDLQEGVAEEVLREVDMV